MNGIKEGSALIFSIAIILCEILAYLGMLKIFKHKKQKRVFSCIYICISAIFLTLWFLTLANPDKIRNTDNYYLFYFIIGFLVINLVPKFILSLGTIISSIAALLYKKAQHIILHISYILSLGVFLSIGYGIFLGRRQIITKEVSIGINQLPKQLDGLRIIHISDLHLGCFNKQGTLQNAAEIINKENGDLLLFTGDIVNNFASEINGFESPLASMHAKYGKYAIYGNHDYGDYSHWDSKRMKDDNHRQIYDKIEDAGFTLLSNQNERVAYKDTCLYIIGVENWGHPPFPQYADMDKAILGIDSLAFTILLTHDPAHWEDEIKGKTNIPLSLSGHTHGGQFGVNFAGITFSPMYFIEHLWGGLYHNENQHLYVNQGFGSVGFPGRIDMNPEITVITLRAKN